MNLSRFARILGLLLAASPLAITAAEPSAPSRPNIVFILADDLGYGDVQGLSPQHGRIPTPHLDRLAAEGLVFTEAHSGSSVCTPTRYGLLTGRYAWRTRLQKGVLDGGNDEPLIAEDRLTVAGFLGQQGYATACIGKWHLGFQSDAAPAKGAGGKKMGGSGLPLGAHIIGGPTTRGFGSFWGCSNARTMSSIIVDDRVAEMLAPVEVLPALTQKAVAYLAAAATPAREGTPFFLYVPLTSPHTPIVPAPEWQGKSSLGAYGDFVMQTDDTVGQILAALKEHRLADNTLVLFSADNGCSPQAGTEKLEKQGHFASAGRRGYKADIWDGGHRVPLLACWPGVIPAGSRTEALVCLGDFMATVADITGAALPESAAPDSISFLPLLKDPDAQAPRTNVIHHSISGQFSIREGQWKLSLCAGSGGWSQPSDSLALKDGSPDAQLHNVQKDPSEADNQIRLFGKTAEALLATLRQQVEAGRSTPGPRQTNDVPVRLPDLRSVH